MIYMYVYMLMMSLILMLMLIINLIISKKINKNREKMSPFECGFDNLSENRMPFSLQFYLITIIFLIFDIEITMILPMINSYSFMYYLINYNMIFIFIILLLGLFLEMKEGALNWFK